MPDQLKTGRRETTEPRAKPHILVVEDEQIIATALDIALRFLGFETAIAATGRAALGAARAHAPDVVLLDVALPDLDGFEVCRLLRATGARMPVLFLTARDTVEDKIRGLTLGGDDYVAKPFDINEVAARIHALLRRGREPASVMSRHLRAWGVVVDREAREARLHGQPVALSATEFELLCFLLENVGKAVSKVQILDAVWKHEFAGESGIVETYVYYLRRKLGDVDQSLIRTVRGIGYMIPAPPAGGAGGVRGGDSAGD